MAASLTASVGMPVDPARILLVDDQPARLLTYEAILAPLGEELVAVQSGEEALRRLMETEFAVILLDVSMPGLDGFETAGLIHAHPRFENTPIIFVTGVHVGELDRLEGYRLGAIDYVQIPLVPDILRSKVAVLVELYRRRRELRTLNQSLAGENANLVQANLALQTERAREYQALSETLAAANAKLSEANAALESEVAERRHAEQVSLQLATSLRKLDRRKDEFLATLAHELRNPLAPIRNAVAVLRGRPLDEATSQHTLEVIDRQVRQLVRLVDDLLDVSRITYDRIELKRERVEIGAILSATRDMALPSIEQRNQTLALEPPIAPVHVHGDPQRLIQVVGNLLNNASKYTPPGGTIALAARSDGERVRVSVTDDGIGISAEDLRNVFDLFVQVDAAREHAQGGLGIGLTLVKRLVEMHGGTVAAESDGRGRGSRFTIELPCAVDASPAQQASVAPGVSGARIRVVIVDDNRDAADMLALTLQMLGHETKVVYDPLLALDAIAAFGPRVAFVDLGMPRLGGIELAGMIRERFGASIRLVALTGWGQPADRERTREAGFDFHFVKPIDLAEVEKLCSVG
ncbi:response regulator [Dokdonella sp.]|uniref:ATP-binding response regulator n=1 Tax=Dokdonella sp. TaxID=2291710 RepID=UPI002F41E749